jgi:hypothetical protein
MDEVLTVGDVLQYQGNLAATTLTAMELSLPFQMWWPISKISGGESGPFRMIRTPITTRHHFNIRPEEDRFLFPQPKPIMVCPVLSTLYLARKYAHEEDSYWRDMMDMKSEVYEETTMGVVDGHSRWMIYKTQWTLHMKVEIMRPSASQAEMVMTDSDVAPTKPYTIDFSI